MPETTSIQSVVRGSVAYVRVYGVIDESFDPKKLVAAAEGKDVLINLKAVTRISSFGVREWVHAITQLAEKVSKIYFVECSPAIVAQLNMIANFAGRGHVVSVQVPMVCPSCDWDTEALVDMAKYTVGTQPNVPCRRCSTATEIDDLPEQYFAFALKGTQPIDPSVEAFLHEFASALPPQGADGQAPAASPPSPPPAPLRPPPPPPTTGNPMSTMPTSLAAPAAVASSAEPPKDKPVWRPSTAADLSDRELQFAKRKPPYVWIGLALLLVAGLGYWLFTREPQPEPPPLPNAKNTKPASQPVAASQPASAPVAAPPKIDAAAEKTKALAAYAAKDWAKAVAAGKVARDNGEKDPALVLAMADANRQLKNADAAIADYAEAEAALPPKDKRLDDALFFHAELVAAGDDPLAAKPLYDRLMKEFPKSAHKKAAKAALGKLKKAKKKKK